jgi:predicted peroxiredoxin
MTKVAITCNGAESKSVYPALIMGSSSAALGYQVVLFFTPAGAPALVKGELEKMGRPKGLPDLIDLYNGLRDLDGRIWVCELCLDVHDLREDDFREGVEIVGVTAFLGKVQDATLTFSF